MNKIRRTACLTLALIGLGWIAVRTPAALGSQSTSRPPDPFYLKLISDGAQLYQAQSYREAVQSFDVASFGLSQDKVLLGKVLGYLSLCYFNLKDDVRAKDSIVRLIGLVGLDGLAVLAMEDQDRSYLAQIAAYYKLDKPPSAQAGPARTDIFGASRPAGPGQKPATPAEEFKALEAKIKAEPKNSQAYLDLYAFQVRQKNIRGARRALLDLMKQVPRNPAGPLLLGKMRYGEKDFDEAVEYLEKALVLKKDAPASDKDYAEAQAYLILSYNALAKKPLLEKTARSFLARVSPESVQSFDLTDKDKNLALSILGRYGQAAPAAAAGPVPSAVPPDSLPPRDAQSIQKEIKNSPGDSSLYYGLYDLYRQKKDKRSAKQTLEKLVKNNPREVKAYLLLGKVNYEEKEYEDAAEAFLKVFGLPADVPVDEALKSEAAFYLALSSHLNKDKALALETHHLYLPLIQKFLSGGAPVADSDLVAWQNLRLLAEASPQVYLLAVRLEKKDEGLTVAIDLSKPTTYRTFIMTRERSIVIELFQMAGTKAPSLVPVNARGIKAVRSGPPAKDVIRVVVECQAQIPSHRIVKTDSGLSVFFE